VVGLALAITGVVRGFGPLYTTDAEVPPDGETHTVHLEPDSSALVWLPDDDTITCQAPGVELRPPGGSFSRSLSHGPYTGVGLLDTGDGEIDLTCQSARAGDDRPVQLGPPMSAGRLVGIFGGIFVGGSLALAGAVVLVLTLVLRRVRRA